MAEIFKYRPQMLSDTRLPPAFRLVVSSLPVLLWCFGATLMGAQWCVAAPATASIVPSRQVEQLQQEVPEWKRSWDTARRMVLAGDYSAAAGMYESLLVQRPGLEEARWELAEIYIQQRAWSQAVSLLERLLDGSPERGDYLNALAKVMEAQKHWGRAVELFARVLEKYPADMVAVQGMGRGLLALNRPGDALPYIERAYRQDSGDQQRRLALADLAYGLGEYELARPHLVALATPGNVSSEILMKAARLHEKLGLQNLAVIYWQRLLKRSENLLEAHQRLAVFFEKAGDFVKALPHLRYQSLLAPEDASLWLRIAKALLATSRRKEALSYLDRYVAAVPDDIDALEMLVNLYAQQGEKVAAAARLDSFFAVKEQSDTGRVKQAARLYEAAGRFAEAVTAYRRYLSLAGSDQDAKQAMAVNLRRLGVRGRFKTLTKFAEEGAPSSAVSLAEYRMMIASSFVAGGLWSRAIALYELVISENTSLAPQGLLALSDLYVEMGLPYEAEQSLRQALLNNDDPGPVLFRLFELAILVGNVDDAALWQQQIALLAKGSLPSWQVQLSYARLAAARGENWLAIRSCQRLLATLTNMQDPVVANARFEIREAMAGFSMEIGDYISARRQLEKVMAADHSPELSVLVLLQQLYLQIGLPEKAGEVFLTALSQADGMDEGLLRLADLYRRRGMVDAMGKVASLIGQRLPDSPRAVLLEAEACRLAGQFGKAEDVLQPMVVRYQGESGAAVFLLRLLFAHGRFTEALALDDRLVMASFGRPDVMLLRARILWALDRRPEAIKVYKTFLTPSVACRLQDEIEEQGLSSPPLVAEPTFWQIITLRGEEPVGFIDTIMAAEYVAAAKGDSLRQRFNAVAVRYFARYKWQKRFLNEDAARCAEQRKDFFYAVRQYQAVLRADPDSFSLLFDLARIYRCLGWLGKEAGVYEQLATQEVDFPGLTEARQRNLLKRRPLAAVSYGYQEEDGREGYKNMRRDWQEASLHFSPWSLSRHGVDLSLSRQRYRPIGSDFSLRANRALFSYSAGLTSWLSGQIGAGIESPLDDEITKTGLLQGGLTCLVGDKVTGEFSFDRKVVADTQASLTRNVVRKTVKGGTSLDLLPRLQVGADYSFVDFSDGNSTTGYDFWSSYLLFTEPHSLRLRYMYDFKDSREGHFGGAVGADGFAVADHPYWTPMNYWRNRFVVSYRHQLSEEILDRDGPTYYTAEYSIDYDSMGRQLQSIGGSLFYEWSSHYIVEAAASLTSSELYRCKDFSLSLVYRW